MTSILFSLFWSASELNSFGGGKVNREKTFHASIDTVCVFFLTSTSDRIASKYKAHCPIVCFDFFENKNVLPSSHTFVIK